MLSVTKALPGGGCSLQVKWADIAVNIGFDPTWNGDVGLNLPYGVGNFNLLFTIATAVRAVGWCELMPESGVQSCGVALVAPVCPIRSTCKTSSWRRGTSLPTGSSSRRAQTSWSKTASTTPTTTVSICWCVFVKEVAHPRCDCVFLCSLAWLWSPLWLPL